MIRHARALFAASVLFAVLLAPAEAMAAKSVVNTIGSTATGTTGALFNTPRGVAVNRTGNGGVPAGTTYVVDALNNRVQRFSPSGEFVSTWGWDVSTGGDTGFEICTVAASCKAGVSGNGAGQLNNAQGVAVDQATGNVFVSNQTARRISVFFASGGFQAAFGWGALDGNVAAGNELELCTAITGCAAPNTTAGAQGGKLGNAIGGLAVDASGNLYVANRTSRRIDVFSLTLSAIGKAVTAAGFLRAFGWGVATGAAEFQVCTEAATCKVGATTAPGNNPGQFGSSGTTSPADVAIDSAGDVYALDVVNKRVQKFSSAPAVLDANFGSAALLSTFGVGASAGTLDGGIAIDTTTDRVYVGGRRGGIAIADTGPSTGTITVKATTGPYLLSFAGENTAGNSFNDSAAVVQAALEALPVIGAGNVTVTGGPGSADGSAPYDITFTGALAGTAVSQITVAFSSLAGPVAIEELDSSGAHVETHGADLTPTAMNGLAVIPDSLGGNIYLSSAQGTHSVFVLNTPAAAALDDITVKTATTATFSGTVDPNGGTVSCLFQYSTDQVNWTDVPEPDCASLAPGGGPQAVSESVSGLQPNKLYHVRLQATKSGLGTATSPTKSFTTDAAPPSVSSTAATKIGADTATLNAAVNPNNQTTTWRFEYVEETEFQANGFANATSVPTADVLAGSGGQAVAVSEKVNGLSPATAYRFRAAATNASSPLGGTPGAEVVFTTHAQPSLFDPCPNDALRSGPSANLPDCRAFEQASPIDKNGGNIQGSNLSTSAAEDGSAISFESPAGIPAGSGAQAFPTYVARRGADGWSTKGLLPDASSGQQAKVLGWTPDFATAFDEAELFGQGNSLLARAIASGTQTEIVPHTLSARYRYLGSSEDGVTSASEVSEDGSGAGGLQLTPDAAAGEPNVYAWSRETGELRLAGVLPDGSTPPLGSQSAAGALNVSAYDYDMRVVSADGSVLFTDRKDGQLYLRLNPTAKETEAIDGKGNCIPDPVLACTVHISASQKDNGKGPGNADAAGAQAASFMAASPDGSVITFTSSEKLTNDANTGTEPDAPAIARAKASEGGEKDPEFIPTFAREIAIDETGGHVYWSDPANGRIGRAKLDGTDFTAGYITGLSEPLGIAVINEAANKYVFWTERGPLDAEGKPQAGKGTIGRANLDGTDVKPDCLKDLTNPRSIAVRPDFIYWTIPDIDSGFGDGEVGRAELTCNEASVEPQLLGNAGVGAPKAGGDIAVDGSRIYISFVSGFEVGAINTHNLDGTTVETGVIQIADVKSKTPLGLALDTSHLYWTDFDHSRIGRSDLDGSNQEPDFITEAIRAEDLGIGDEYLYWTGNQKVAPNPGKDLYQLNRESGKLTDLAPDTTDVNGVEVLGVLGASEDGSYVYFAANGVPDEVGNSPNEAGESVAPGDCKGTGDKATGTCNLYVAHEGQVDFIARLDAQGRSEEAAGDALNWITSHVQAGKDSSDKSARVSADGRALVFRSHRQLTAYDNQGPRCLKPDSVEPGPCLEFYRFDYETMSLACVTCNPMGSTPEGPAQLASIRAPLVVGSPPAAMLSRNLSRDGKRFLFETPDTLVAGDTNSETGCPAGGSGSQEASTRTCQDVYEWEAPGTGSCTKSSPAYSSQNAGCIYLISTGKSKEPSFFGDVDLDGEDIFIFTYEQLVPQDKDGLLDVYDAREGGGLASQHQVEAPPCAGEACKAPPSAPLAPQSPGSAGFAGPTDPQPKRAQQRKRKRRKQAKQRRKRAAKAKQKARQKQRAAKQSRRAGR